MPRQLSSPNCNARAAGIAVNYLILHFTRIGAAEAESRFMNSNPTPYGEPVSAHYMIDYDGSVTQFVAEDLRAWHAGTGRFDGLTDFNSRSVGIELVNNGDEEYPVAQMHSLKDLALGVMARHPIPPCNVLGHEDIAPDRKTDPGPLLDWAWLARHGVGIWPEPAAQDAAAAAAWNFDTDPLAALVAAGYDGSIDPDMLWEAFYNHYMPDPSPAATAWLHRLGRMRQDGLAKAGLARSGLSAP